MTRRIRADIINGLETLVEEHGDIFYRYVISDDLRQVRIYETPGGIGLRGLNALYREGTVTEIGIGRLRSIISLYHAVKDGHSGLRNNSAHGFIEWRWGD